VKVKIEMSDCRVTDLGVLPYLDAFALQKDAVRERQGGTQIDHLYFVEHPHVFTIGRNADGSAIIADQRTVSDRNVDTVETDRGGDVTYHGPGQLVGYPIIQLEDGRRDIRRYVHDLEEVLIRTLSDFDVLSSRDDEHRGVWTEQGKIASVGIRISRWVTCHGFALNVNTDLSYFSMLNPCGIANCEMASISMINKQVVPMRDVMLSITSHFGNILGRDMIANSLSDRKTDAG